MNRHHPFRFVIQLALRAALVVAAISIATVAARAQCEINGPSAYCGSAVVLCGPDGGSSYSWVLPNGSTRLGQCILANTPGTYELRYIDDATGQSVGPCRHELITGGATAVITGPTTGCAGQSLELCATAGDLEYDWTGPNGFSAGTACVNVSEAGTYQLRVRPVDGSCWSVPAQKSVSIATSPGPAPTITGETSGCTGENLELCGPSGSLDYDWTGPNGFAASTACVNVSVAGTYGLRVRSVDGGCWSDPAQQPVSFASCTELTNCPRPVWWWERQCSDHHWRNLRLDPEMLRAVANCVDGHAPSLGGGFCRTMAWRHTLSMRARRQVAAVWANVCAGELGTTSHDGRPVALDPTTLVNVAGFQGTVASWLESAGAELSRLQLSTDRHRESKEAYRRLIRVGWHINHGIGIGPVCMLNLASQALTSDSSGDQDESAARASGSRSSDPEPLAAELIDDADTPLAFGVIEPNPFKDQMRLAYVVQTPSAAEVTIGVYDLSGRLVRELVRGSQAPGSYVALWDGRDSAGSVARGGLYFVLGRVAGDRVQTRVTLVR